MNSGRTALLALLALLIMSLTSPASAQDSLDNCDPYPDVPVYVTPTLADATFDYSTSIGALRALETSTHHFYERLLLGVTTYTPDIRVENFPKSITMPNGISCVKIQKVEIAIDFKDVVVHVANEIPQGSCGFDEVVAHEQKHVAVNQALIQEYVPLIQQKLQEYLKLNGMLQEGNYGYAMTLLHDNMKAFVDQTLHEMSQQEQERQQLVDTDGEFLQMSRSCNGQLGRIAAQFRQTGR
jgi:hypothetical protein